jgi:hypothetical protein
VNERDRESAAAIRSLLESGRHDAPAFHDALLTVAPASRDTWLDRVLGLGDIPDDGPDLPRDCVPYLPCPVDAVLRTVEQAAIRRSDVFVDVGSGVGRAGALVHLLTGASVIGLEVQHGLVLAARDLARRLRLSRVSTVEGDASTLTGRAAALGTVFFLYCPFSGNRLERVLANLEPLARARMLRVCCVDLPLPSRPWLTRETLRSGDLTIHRTTLHDET